MCKTKKEKQEEGGGKIALSRLEEFINGVALFDYLGTLLQLEGVELQHTHFLRVFSLL